MSGWARGSLALACVAAAAIGVTLCLPGAGKPEGRDGAARWDGNVAMPTEQGVTLAQLKALPVSRKEQPAPPQQLAGGANDEGSRKDKPCDDNCKHMKEVGKERMRQLRNEIDSDFNSMVDFGEASAYVPPVESVEQQVKDGSLYKDPSEDDANAPPAVFAGGAIVAADPGASADVLAKGEVKDVAAVVKDQTPSAADLLKKIQDAESAVHAVNPLAVASDADATNSNDPSEHEGKGLPAGVTFGNEVVTHASTAPAAAVAAAPVPAQVTKTTAETAPTPEAAKAAAKTVGAIKPIEQIPPLDHEEEPVAAAPVSDEASAVTSGQGDGKADASSGQTQKFDVMDNFPHVGSTSESDHTTAQDHADARQDKEWAKAFAFVHQTDNPVVGDTRPNTLHGTVEHPEAASHSSPLKDDGFLKGFWG